MYIIESMSFGEKLAVGALLFFVFGGMFIDKSGGNSGGGSKPNNTDNTGTPS